MSVPPSFRDLTTLRVGGPTGSFVRAATTEELVATARAADADGVALLVLGGGSNLVVGDAGWEGRTVQVASGEVEIDGSLVRADAGVDWDRLVEQTVGLGLAGLECLSGIPGTVGGTPVQNVGAFGALTSDVLESVRVLDRRTGTVADWAAEQCGFGPHRQSVFKHSDRWIVLRVDYRLRPGGRSGPLRFDAVTRRLGLAPESTAPIDEVRAAVLALRRQRGSILDPDDHDTWSVGSFFLNPVVAEVPAAAAESPRYPDVAGVKLPAGWLIEHAGFAPGYGRDWGRGTVALSSKHALAVTNRGGATTADVTAFAAHVRAGVQAEFGIRLQPECRLVNCSLDD